MAENITNIKERILQIAELKDVSKESFCEKIGMSYGNFKGKSKNSAINSNAIAEIVTLYPDLNLRWLITGDGEMQLNESVSTSYVSEPVTPYNLRTDHSIQSQSIPLYNKEASASLISLFQNHTTEMQIGTLSIPNIPSCDGAIYITGDSMYPLLKSGDMVLFKKVPDPQQAILFFGEMYLLCFTVNDDDYVAVKWLQRSEQKDHIKLVSENQHHDSIDIPLSSITALALIKDSVRINSMK